MTCNLFLAKFNHLTPLGLFHFSLQLTDELRHIPEKLMGPASMGFLQNTPQDNLKLDLSLPALLRRWVELEVWRLGVILFMCIPSPGDKNLLSPGDNKHPSPGDKNVPSPGDNNLTFPGDRNFPSPGEKTPFSGDKISLPREQEGCIPCFDRRLAGQIEGEEEEKTFSERFRVVLRNWEI